MCEGHDEYGYGLIISDLFRTFVKILWGETYYLTDWLGVWSMTTKNNVFLIRLASFKRLQTLRTYTFILHPVRTCVSIKLWKWAMWKLKIVLTLWLNDHKYCYSTYQATDTVPMLQRKIISEKYVSFIYIL